MKRIAIISLLAVFLTTNYAYATLTAEKVSQAMERAQYGELIQDEAEELYVSILSSVDWEAVSMGDVSSIESIIQPQLSTGCIVLLIITTLLTIFFPPLASTFAALYERFC